MIQTKIKGLERLKEKRGWSDAHFSAVLNMQKLGQVGRDSVVARVRKGIGSNDSPMPPLSSKTSAVKNQGKVVRIRGGYAEAKAKRGLQPFRDLYGTGKQGGHMLDNFTVRPPSKNANGAASVKIAFTQTVQRVKALANERRASFAEFSPTDTAKVFEAARLMFRAGVRSGNFKPSELIYRRKVA